MCAMCFNTFVCTIVVVFVENKQVPVFWVSGYIMKRFGVRNCLVFTFICFFFRFLIYSLMKSPWTVLAAEPLHGITFALMWASCTNFANEIAPPGLGATMQGVLTGLHFGLGLGLGSVIGGAVFDSYGPRPTFRSGMGTSAFALLIILLSKVPFINNRFFRDSLSLKEKTSTMSYRALIDNLSSSSSDDDEEEFKPIMFTHQTQEDSDTDSDTNV
eukprot:m.33454 g.33454  ORF g.33454 m.33454 type:complete len:215 (+) comp9864_c0_seq2:86-730(+)